MWWLKKKISLGQISVSTRLHRFNPKIIPWALLGYLESSNSPRPKTDTQGRIWGTTLDFSLSSTILPPSFSSAWIFCALLPERRASVAVAARCWRWRRSRCRSRGEGTWGGCLLFCWHLWSTDSAQWISSVFQCIVSFESLHTPDILLSSLHNEHIPNPTHESEYRPWYL